MMSDFPIKKPRRDERRGFFYWGDALHSRTLARLDSNQGFISCKAFPTIHLAMGGASVTMLLWDTMPKQA